MKPKQVSVRLLASANNVAAAQLLLTAGRAAIDRYLLPAGPAAANPPPRRAASVWDRQIDGRTDGRSIFA